MACSTKYRASKQSGVRDLSRVLWVVIHDTEGGPEHGPSGTADNTAAYFASPTARGSAHLVIDDSECYRTLPDDLQPWAAVNANERGLHLEFAARASYATAVWKKEHREMLRLGARHVAGWCFRYQLNPKHLRNSQLAAFKTGVVSHAQVDEVWPSTGHTDPGTGFPWVYFMWLVRKELRRMRDVRG